MSSQGYVRTYVDSYGVERYCTPNTPENYNSPIKEKVESQTPAIDLLSLRGDNDGDGKDGYNEKPSTALDYF